MFYEFSPASLFQAASAAVRTFLAGNLEMMTGPVLAVLQPICLAMKLPESIVCANVDAVSLIVKIGGLVDMVVVTKHESYSSPLTASRKWVLFLDADDSGVRDVPDSQFIPFLRAA